MEKIKVLCKYTKDNEYCPFSDTSTKHISTAIPELFWGLDLLWKFQDIVEAKSCLNEKEKQEIYTILWDSLGYSR